MKSKRFENLAKRPVNQETFIKPWPETGLEAMASPLDPAPGLKILDGQVVEMDGVSRDDFDIIDHFIVDHALDLKIASKAMAKMSRACKRIAS